MSLDDNLVQQVDRLGATLWSGETFRYTTARRDALSGAGARLFGGRWNPKDIFATIYLATPLDACLGELERAAESQQTPVQTMLEVPYRLHTISVQRLGVLDLRKPSALAAVGLNEADIADQDWTACQAVGHAAWFLELAGVLAPSATGEGFVLAVFENHVNAGQLAVDRSEPLTSNLYTELRNQH